MNNLSFFATEKMDIYKGIEGKRLAFKRFLSEIQKLEEPADVYVTTGSNLLWLSESKEFIESSRDYFIGLLDKVKGFYILHSFDRSVSTLIYFKNYWIPIYLTGKISGYVLNDYYPNQPKYTIFIIDNRICVFSLETESMDDSITFFSESLDVITSMKNIFLSMQKNSVPLGDAADKCPNHFVTELFEAGRKPGSYFAFFNAMAAIGMPPSIYKNVLKSLDLPLAEQKEKLKLYCDCYEEFMENIVRFHHSIVIKCNPVYEFSNFEKIRYNGIYFFENRDIYVDKELYIKHLENLLEISKESKLNIIFLDPQNYINKSPGFNYILKENEKVVVFDKKQGTDTYQYFSSESKILTNNFFLYHNNIIGSIQGDSLDPEKISSDIIKQSQACRNFDSEDKLKVLTNREKVIVKMLYEGIKIYDISIGEHISQNTVKTHIRNIYRKLGINSKYELIKLLSEAPQK
ncbi:MAG TPA: LuxR C-terminal-related transcriptional regulator [Pseudobacteroides sp.]|uniref:helix-turn-helix domain-containing protein n=1 Tax=Pseudobacteroides sp. TaxID=1968840 RepID=UPI002F9389C5